MKELFNFFKMKVSSESTDDMTPILESNFRINPRFLLMKLHFFFFLGSTGAVYPFLPILGKGLGITATAVGIVYTVLCFIILIAKPTVGAITDYFNNLKTVMILIAIVALGSCFSISYIPPIMPEKHYLNFSPIKSCNESSMPDHITYVNFTCLDKLVEEYVGDCNVTYENCTSYLNRRHVLSTCNNISFNETSVNALDLLNIGVIHDGAANDSCSCDTFMPFFVMSDMCFSKIDEVDDINVYKTSQFWVYAALVLIFCSFASCLGTLNDTACYAMLGDDSRLYGRQRLWGTIGYGGVTLFTGYLNGAIHISSSASNYAPGFYLMAGMFIIDIIILSFSKLEKTVHNSSICKDVSKIFTSLEIVMFAVSVLIIGILTGLLNQYLFWYLTDLGASQFLLGVTVSVQCLLAEVPSLFVSGKIIDMFGHVYCVVGSFIAFAIRYVLYFYLINPWWVLPIELFHGQTFGVFIAAMTSFAKAKAPPGAEATMMGILGGLFEGLGIATGSFLGGIGFDKLKGRYTFLTASIISAVCGTLLCLIYSISKLKCWQRKNHANGEKMEEYHQENVNNLVNEDIDREQLQSRDAIN